MLNRLLFKKHLADDETLIRVVHPHWLFGLGALFWPSVVLALPWVAYGFTGLRGWLVVSAVLTCVIGIWWLRSFFDYFLDAWIITNQGIIDVEWFGWFHRQSTRVLYSDLQGVSYEIKGLWATVLRYGDISIEKISTGQAITLERVPRPKRAEHLILQSMEKYLHAKNMKDATHVKDLLSALVAEHAQLQDLPAGRQGLPPRS